MKKPYIAILIVFIINIDAEVQLVSLMESLLGNSVQYYLSFLSISLIFGIAMAAELSFYFTSFENKQKNKGKNHESKSINKRSLIKMKKSYIFVLVVSLINVAAMVQLILTVRSLLGNSIQCYFTVVSIIMIFATAMPAELSFFFTSYENKQKNKEKNLKTQSGDGSDTGDGLGDTVDTK